MESRAVTQGNLRGTCYISKGSNLGRRLGITAKSWGRVDGQPVFLFTLTNKNGSKLQFTNYGARVVSIIVPDHKQMMGDVVLGHDNLNAFLKDGFYLGCGAGRCGNRIAGGKFQLPGQKKVYKLATNNGPNHLHGGYKGFDKVVWEAKQIVTGEGPGVELAYISRDGEEGYPGKLFAKITYLWTDKNEFKIHYYAVAKKETIVNLTNHTYFNLGGQEERNILSHDLMINAEFFTPTDDTAIPTGKLSPVEGTPFDFKQLHAVGERIGQNETQLSYGKGYDHNFVLHKPKDQPDALTLAAGLYDPKSGRSMEVWTTEPGVQFYSGNYLNETITGKGRRFDRCGALCLETQHFPNSINQPEFPSVVYGPDRPYRSTTIFKFGVV
jgi:aldose 1-epimerase